MGKMVVVLGMHRSGTSLVAEIVQRWGAAAGEGGRLLEGDEYNARGYFEHLPLLELNNALLEAAGGSWRAPPPETAAVEALADDREFAQRARRLIEEFEAGGEPWFWKDPRIPALLPFWEKFWPDPAFIVPVREPLHIARSLARRDGLSRPAALLLWQHAMLAIVDHVDDRPEALLLSYEETLADPATQSLRIGAFLHDECGPRAGRPADGETLAAAVDRTLDHGDLSDGIAGAADATAGQKALHAFLLDKVADPSLEFDAARYPMWPGWSESLRTLEELERAEKIIAEKDAHMRSMRHSASYRLGRALTKPLRLLLGR